MAGWVRTYRNDRLIALNDGRTIRYLQCVINQEKVDAAIRPRFTMSAAVKCTREPVPSQGSGQRVGLKIDSVEVLGDSDAEKYPVHPRKHNIEFLRASAPALSHDYLHRGNPHAAPGELQLPPVLRPERIQLLPRAGHHHQECGRSGEMLHVTTLNANSPPRSENNDSVDHAQDFFGREVRLTVSGELQAEL